MTANSPHLETASADGFVDFYQLIGVSPDAPEAQIQESINSLYQDAQTHRDHRVAARRREYEYLLEILPQARTILLDPARRKRYNAYCAAVTLQSPRIPYPEFLAALLREKDVADPRSNILTLSDLSRLRPGAPTASTEPKSLTSLSTAPATPATVAAGASEVAAQTLAEQTEESVATGATPQEIPLESASEPAAPRNTIFSFLPPIQLSPQSWCGGVVVFVGSVVFLPLLAGVPLLVCVPLSAMSAFITTYVFSLAEETEMA